MSDGDTEVIKPSKLPPIGGGSTITLGFLAAIVTLLLGMAGFFVGAIWWASSLQTKVDYLVQREGERAPAEAAMNKEVADLKLRISVLEARNKTP